MLSDFIKTTTDLYIFPKDFINVNNVLKGEERFSGWCDIVKEINSRGPVGITWSGDVCYTYWRPSEFNDIDRQKIYIVQQYQVLGGL